MRRGLVVVVGESVDLAVALARAEPVVVHVVAPAGGVGALREKVVAAGVHGQVTVSPIGAGGRLNVADGTAGVVIVESGPGVGHRGTAPRPAKPQAAGRGDGSPGTGATAAVVAASTGVPSPAKAELLRVLRFGGRLLLRRGGVWEGETRPRPGAIDEQRLAALDELAAQAQDLDMGY